VDALVSSSTGKTVTVTVPIRVLSSKEKQKRAIKALLLCWAASIATIPLPPLHWVTVPGLFLGGFYMFFRRMNEKEHSEPFSFQCPECGGEVKVEDRPLTHLWEQVCPQCHFALKVEIRGTPGATA
jgi:hypothetical protein